MRVLILGGDGYLGWPTAMNFAAAGHEVCVVDNYLRRHIAEATDSEALSPRPALQNARVSSMPYPAIPSRSTSPIRRPGVMFDIVREFGPETIIHYAEQPSAPYSMRGFREAQETFNNNLNVTFNCIHAVKDIVPDCHIVNWHHG